ncbi:MAG: endolytic transglycosylase MltG [Candidatus Hydrogenedentes bacterium]|nr:endolytic transglycosylase MltG [Candidatus Hydrogenedentota bacterium]
MIKKGRKITILLMGGGSFLILIFILIVCSLFVYLYRELPGGEEIEIVIPKGATGKEIGRILKDRELIVHEYVYLLMTKLHPSLVVKYGVYKIPKGISPKQIIDIFSKGPVKQLCEYKITIPEGLTNWQIAMLSPNPDEFLKLVDSSEFIKSMGFDAPTAEGFLFPATYCFEEIPDSYTLAKAMVEKFKKEWNKLVVSMNLKLNNEDLYRILKIASLVEEESKIKDEKSLISRVIYNRLEKNMPLQVDATLQYALRKYGEPLSSSDKEVDSPFNTYKILGLPPTPICNPGMDSIVSALKPAEGDFLFYVVSTDGKSHVFSRSYDEHLKAVREYRSRNSDRKDTEK